MGCVILSESIVHGHAGVKMTFRAGIEVNVRVFCTDAFKGEAPGLTALLRQACSLGHGWRAVTQGEAVKKDGWKWGLVLRGKQEDIPSSGRKCKFLQIFTGDEFVSWATKEFVLETQSAWVKGS